MLNQLRLTGRVWGVVGAMWVLLLLLMWNGYWGLSEARQSLHEVEARLVSVNSLSRMADGLLENRLGLILAFQHNPASELAKLHDHPVTTHLDAVATSRAATDREWTTYVSGLVRDDERQLATVAEQKRQAWRLKLDQVISAVAQGDYGVSTMQLLLVAGRTEGVQAVKAVEVLKTFQEARAKEASTAAEARYQRALELFFAVVFLGGVPSLLFTVLVMRRLSGGLALAQTTAHAIAQGELGQAVEVDGTDEVGQLLTEMATMRTSLVGIIEQVRSGADHIATASSQVATGTEDLASRTERQAGSVQETVAAVEELNGAVKRNAEHASSADQVAGSAADVATRGGEAVSAVVQTMEEIKESSRKIVDIIAVIDEIAFQTNILALNAAVEAARAGEHGRGFAVVAGEVRTLARRAGESAKEIRGLIDTSVGRISAGAAKVSNAGDTMKEIVDSIRAVTRLVNEIAASSREQATGLAQIRDAITSMGTSTQQNAALVEETSAASLSLSDQAKQLTVMVNRFHLS